MHTHDLSPWRHSHRFGSDDSAGERGTRLVMWITAVVMVVEIGAGWWFNSMALLADGWHMSSHAFAIGLSAFAYGAMRRHASDPGGPERGGTPMARLSHTVTLRSHATSV